MRNIVLICLALLISMPAIPQISSGGTPPGFNLSLKSAGEIPVYILPELDHNQLLMEDIETEATGCNYRVAKGFQVSLNPDNSGLWTSLPDGSRIWRLKIKSPGALGLNIFFDQFRLPDGARVFIYSPDKREVLGAYTSDNNKKFGKLNVQPLAGEELVVEYFEPAGLTGRVLLHIGNIGHFYKVNNLFDTGFGTSEPCNRNVACADGDDWRDEIRSAAMILFESAGGYYLCSGALINNLKSDGRPYFLTANHCLPTSMEASSALYYFNYESPQCYPNQDGVKTQTVSGSTILGTFNRLDFCLVELSSPPPASYNVFYSGWDATPDPPTSCITIHHPLGDVKKISTFDDTPETGNFVYQFDFDDNTHWYIDNWTKGITQGGSSGSPLYNQDKRIVGDLTGGTALGQNCTSADAFYAKFSDSYANYSNQNYQLKHWLDPDNTGVTSMTGIDASMATGITYSESDLYSVYPNPVDDIIHLYAPSGHSPTGINIYDVSGRMIKSISTTGQGVQVRVDVSDLSPGLYILELKDRDQSVTKKITIK